MSPQSLGDGAGAIAQTSVTTRRGRWVVIAALFAVGLIAALVTGLIINTGDEPSLSPATQVAPVAPATSSVPTGTSAPVDTAARDEEGASAAPATVPADEGGDLATPATGPADDGAESVDDDASAPGVTSASPPTSGPTDDAAAKNEVQQDTRASSESVPTVPQRPVLAVEGGRRVVTARWSADDNGSTIVQWQVNDGRLADEPSGDDTAFEWENAQIGSHTIKVRARNEAGWSAWSESKTVIVYDVPSKPTLDVAGGRRVVTARWSADDNGSTIVQWQVNDGRLPGEPSGDDTAFEWENAQIGSHTIKVRARNEAGSSAWSSEKSASVIDVPSAPRITVAVTGSQIRASWTADNNGATIADWQVEALGQSLEFSGSKTQHGWYASTSGIVSVRVRARNIAGWGPWSSLSREVALPEVLLNRGDSGPTTSQDEGDIPCAASSTDCVWLKIELKNFVPGRYRIYCIHDGWDNGAARPGAFRNFIATVPSNGYLLRTGDCFINIAKTDGRGVSIIVDSLDGGGRWQSRWLR